MAVAVLAAPVSARSPWRADRCHRSRGSPIALQFYPVLGASFSDRLRTQLDPPAFWLLLLALELPAVYPIGMVALGQLAFLTGR